MSNLLSLGSLGINSLSALGPVITAMAGLLQGKTTATRRNDSIPQVETQEVTTQRSPIYIPVAEIADGDIEAAESQNIGNFFYKTKKYNRLIPIINTQLIYNMKFVNKLVINDYN